MLTPNPLLCSTNIPFLLAVQLILCSAILRRVVVIEIHLYIMVEVQHNITSIMCRHSPRKERKRERECATKLIVYFVRLRQSKYRDSARNAKEKVGKAVLISTNQPGFVLPFPNKLQGRVRELQGLQELQFFNRKSFLTENGS